MSAYLSNLEKHLCHVLKIDKNLVIRNGPVYGDVNFFNGNL